MPRRLALALVCAAAATARADTPAAPASPAAPAGPADDVGDQGIGADLGLATGRRTTPGGLRVAGHYLYQLSDQDWFDGIASFTFGGGSAACFHDRSNKLVCDHGSLDGDAVEIAATVRRYFAGQGEFRPFARAGLGLGLIHFGGDGVSGFAIPVHVGGGVRAEVTEDLAIIGQADLTAGIAFCNRGLGVEPQLGFAVTAGAEFRLR